MAVHPAALSLGPEYFPDRVCASPGPTRSGITSRHAENFACLARDELVVPVVHTQPQLLAGLVRQFLGFWLHPLKLAKVTGSACAAARTRDLEVEIRRRLSHTDRKVDQIENVFHR